MQYRPMVRMQSWEQDTFDWATKKHFLTGMSVSFAKANS